MVLVYQARWWHLNLTETDSQLEPLQMFSVSVGQCRVPTSQQPPRQTSLDPRNMHKPNSVPATSGKCLFG